MANIKQIRQSILLMNQNEREEKKEEIGIDNFKYHAKETTYQLAKRTKTPTPLVFHSVKWASYMNRNLCNQIRNNIKVNYMEKNKDVFTLCPILTTKECRRLIYLSESHQYVMLFGASQGRKYRTNTRMITDDESLANLLYSRIRRFVPDEYKINNEIWQICGLNERFRFCKYIKGQKFDIHHDKRCILAKENKASFYTVNIYLNDGNKDYKGGRTLFFDFDKKYKSSNEKAKYKQSSFVSGTAGMALIFNHYPQKYKHSGQELQNGVKYLLRTDVMYKLKKQTGFSAFNEESMTF